MTGRRKGTPCACSDDCGCSSSKGKCIRAINNISPDPNGDFNVNAGTGIIISGDENGIVIANGMPDPASLIAGNNIEITAIGDDLEIALTQDPVINGDLTVNGDIIQNGAAYETHAEKVYSRDDYIIMRDGAIAALAPGDYSGFQVKLYDGVNDGRLVIDNTGVARVGDVGDEQPLLTREESANLNNGALLKWDAANSKAIDEGTVGNDTKPIKIVNGVATPVTNELQTLLTTTKGNIAINNSLFSSSSFMYYMKFGNIVIVTYVLYPLVTGVQTAGTSPFPPTDIVYYSSVESNTSAARSSLITQAGDVRVTVVSGDTNISGFVVYSI